MSKAHCCLLIVCLRFACVAILFRTNVGATWEKACYVNKLAVCYCVILSCCRVLFMSKYPDCTRFSRIYQCIRTTSEPKRSTCCYGQ